MRRLLQFSILLFALGVPAAAAAKPYTLDELLDLARKGNPGLTASEKATASIQAQLLEAKRSYYPTGELNSLLTYAPEIRCYTDRRVDDKGHYAPDTSGGKECVNTGTPLGTSADNFLKAITPAGVFTRTELKLIQPLYTFGKLTAGVAAAESGVKASQERQVGVLADVELNIRKAYWGAKLARELLSTLDEGSRYLEQAEKKIEAELTEGSGDVSVTDRLRLRTTRAEIGARILEAKRGVEVAKSGLRALVGPGAPSDLDIDDAPLAALTLPGRTAEQYEETALRSRPEVQALRDMVTAKRALADLETRKQYPDIFLIGTAAYAYASSVDTPVNAYYNDPFHSLSAGVAAGFRMPLDLFVKNARAVKLRAEADEAEQRQREALTGITFEIEKATAELKEAEERIKVVRKGEKAGRQWIAAIAQNLAVGLAETRDFSDALLAFFQARVRYVQSIYDYNIAAAALTRATGTDIAQSGEK